jgi:NDP-sugar pyrophosphorylase family protein
MNAILICPSPAPAVEQLAAVSPLAGIPFLGETLVEYWLTHLALSGVDDVRILVSDRPEQIAALAGSGARWGLKIEITSEPRQLTPAQAQIKYDSDRSLVGNGFDEIALLDHFPGSAQSLFTSYADLFAGLLEWLPNALTPDRVDVRELRPGIWTGWHTHIPADAQLQAPCWIGQNVYLGARAVVGPGAIIEDRSFVEPDTEIAGAMIGPDTFVGQAAVIRNSLAWGDTLINWKSGLCQPTPDGFLLRALRRPVVARQPESLLHRLNAIYARNKEDFQTLWKHLLINKEG